LTERDLIIAVEGLMGPWHGPAISPDAVAAAAVRHAGARGLVRLRSALSRARPGVGSPQESELRLDLVELGFPEPTVGSRIWVESMQRHLSPDLLYDQIATV